MLVQLFDKPLAGISKEDVREMVRQYRKKTHGKRKMKYSHFLASDIIDLLLKNGVFPKGIAQDVQKMLADPTSKDHLKNYGLKIYLGKHKKEATCPPSGQLKPEDYLKHTTTILCTTDLSENIKNKTIKGFKDMLKQEKYVLIGSGSKSVNPGDGLDQAEISPPYHISPEPGEDGEIYDIGYPQE